MREAGARVGIGRYDEARRIYTAGQFDVESDELPERRTIHLGVDLFMEAGTPVATQIAVVAASGLPLAEHGSVAPGKFSP